MALAENEIRGLCLKSREIFLSQPMLLDLEAPLKVVGEAPLRWNCIKVHSVNCLVVSQEIFMDSIMIC